VAECFLRFENHTGEIRHVSLCDPPRLVKLGDGSLWQFNKIVTDLSERKTFVDYVPAIVEEFSWVHPTKEQASG
jgi:hypothetical protein